MAVTYTKISFPKIEDKLLKVLETEFRNVYISSEYIEKRGDESIRIHLSSSTDVLTTNMFQRREFNIELFFYYEDVDSISRTEYVRDRCDRLVSYLNDYQSIDNYWYNLKIPSVEFDIETDRENFSVNRILITLENHDSV